MSDQFDSKSSVRPENLTESNVKGLDAHPMTLEELLGQKPNLVFAVPVYQRHYKWGETECNRLIEDVLKIASMPGRTHYFGSILVTKDPEYSEANELTLIDGQQRLVTLSLLLAALRNAYEESDVVFKQLSNILQTAQGNTRVKPYKDRIKLFDQIVLEKKRPKDDENEGQEIKNFKTFEKSVKENRDEIWKGIQRLSFVLVELDPSMAQQVFSSINMTGVRLSNADLIHNFVMIGLNRNQQEEIQEIWDKIEKCCWDDTTTDEDKKDHIEDFWDNYLLFLLGMKEKEIKSEGYHLFETFRDAFKDQLTTSFEMRKDKCEKEWLKYAGYYHKFLNPKCIEETKIQRYIGFLKSFNNKAVWSFLLGVYDDYSQNVISEGTLIDVLEILESLFVRRSAAGIQERWPDAITKLYSVIPSSEKTNEHYCSSIINRLFVHNGFPHPDKVENELSMNLYSRLAICGHILKRISESLEPIYKPSLYETKVSIEHIFPQQPDADWSPDGTTILHDMSESQQRWYFDRLNGLGNLTLLTEGDNSSVSNKPYKEKRPVYLKSEFKITEEVGNTYECWTKEALEERSSNLLKRFNEIWKHPKITPGSGMINIMAIDAEEYEQTRKNFKYDYITIGSETIPITNKTMKNVFIEVVRYLWKLDKEKCLKWNDENLIVTFKEPNKEYSDLGGGYYLYKGWRAWFFLRPTQKILHAFGLEDKCFVKLSDDND